MKKFYSIAGASLLALCFSTVSRADSAATSGPLAGIRVNPALNDLDGATTTPGAGAQAGFSVKRLSVGALDTRHTLITPNDRLSVYGLDFEGAIPVFSNLDATLQTSWTESSRRLNSGFSGSAGSGASAWRSQALDTQLGFKAGAFSIKGGYQYVGPDFTAPGYWGKVGAWSNPTNIQGSVASAKYAFTPHLSVNADVQSYKAAYGPAAGGQAYPSALKEGDKISRYQIGLNYGLSSSYAADLGYEEVDWDLKSANASLTTPTKPKEQYITVGLGHTVNKNMSFKLLYQISRYQDGGAPNFAASSSDGNVAVSQFQIKF